MTGRMVLAEWRKAWTLPAAATALALVAVAGGLSGLSTVASATIDGAPPPPLADVQARAALWLGLLTAMAGVVVAGAEHVGGQQATTFLAAPLAVVVATARSVVAPLVSLVIGLAGMGAASGTAVAAGAPLTGGSLPVPGAAVIMLLGGFGLLGAAAAHAARSTTGGAGAVALAAGTLSLLDRAAGPGWLHRWSPLATARQLAAGRGDGADPLVGFLAWWLIGAAVILLASARSER